MLVSGGRVQAVGAATKPPFPLPLAAMGAEVGADVGDELVMTAFTTAADDAAT